MTKRLIILGSLLAFRAISADTESAAAYLQAPRIRSEIRVLWQPKPKALLWDTGTDHGRVGENTLFVSKGAVRVLYPRLNPLRLQATASSKTVDDPAHSTVAELIKAIMSVATTAMPGISATQTAKAVNAMRVGSADAPQACSEPGSASFNVGRLTTYLYGTDASAETLGGKVKGWSSTIDDGITRRGGGQAVRDAAAQIRTDATALSNIVKAAGAFSDRIQQCAEAPNADPLYQSAVLTTAATNLRLDLLSNTVQTMNKLAKTLEDDYTAKWRGEDFEIDDPADPIVPTSDKMRQVTVAVHSIEISVNERTGALNVDREDAGSAQFTVRLYSLLLPEAGVGAVISKLKAPKYGTTTENGKTVVGRVEDVKVAIKPTVLVNFLCRCGIVRFAPMLQIGAVTSSDTPALLGGLGFRLFSVGKGDVAVGAGVVAAWVKELQKLKPGDVVQGTKDIESDLSFGATPRTRAYLSIQYKF